MNNKQIYKPGQYVLLKGDWLSGYGAGLILPYGNNDRINVYRIRIFKDYYIDYSPWFVHEDYVIGLLPKDEAALIILGE